MEGSGGGAGWRGVNSGEFQQHSYQIAVPTRFSCCSPCPRLSTHIKRLGDPWFQPGFQGNTWSLTQIKGKHGSFFFFLSNELQINSGGIFPGQWEESSHVQKHKVEVQPRDTWHFRRRWQAWGCATASGFMATRPRMELSVPPMIFCPGIQRSKGTESEDQTAQSRRWICVPR